MAQRFGWLLYRRRGRSRRGNNDVFGHDRLCVTIWPEKTRVTEKERFDVKLRVVNSSDAIQSSRS